VSPLSLFEGKAGQEEEDEGEGKRMELGEWIELMVSSLQKIENRERESFEVPSDTHDKSHAHTFPNSQRV
jgi:hypothetical protein